MSIQPGGKGPSSPGWGEGAQAKKGVPASGAAVPGMKPASADQIARFKIEQIFAKNAPDIDEEAVSKFDPALVKEFVVLKGQTENNEFKNIMGALLEFMKLEPEKNKAAMDTFKAFIDKDLLLNSVDVAQIKRKHESLENVILGVLANMKPNALRQVLGFASEQAADSPLLKDLLDKGRVISDFKAGRIEFAQLPQNLRENRKVAAAAVAVDQGNYDHISAETKRDKLFAIDLMFAAPEMFDQLDPPLQRDRDVIIATLKNNPTLYQDLPDDLKRDIPIAVAATLADPTSLMYLIDDGVNDDANDAVRRHPDVIKAYTSAVRLSAGQKSRLEGQLHGGAVEGGEVEEVEREVEREVPDEDDSDYEGPRG